jgi:hypothetical protein
MQRHLSDHQRSRAEGTRLREFLRIERDAGHRDVVAALHQKPRTAGTKLRLREFVRIEREERG